MDIRSSLLEVTAQLFAEHGWRGTTTRRIAEAAGVTPPPDGPYEVVE